MTENDGTPARFDSIRAAILERHGTSPEALEAWVEAAAADVAGLAGTWEEVSARLRRPAAADSGAVSTDGRAPPGPLPGRMTGDSMRPKVPD